MKKKPSEPIPEKEELSVRLIEDPELAKSEARHVYIYNLERRVSSAKQRLEAAESAHKAALRDLEVGRANADRWWPEGD